MEHHHHMTMPAAADAPVTGAALTVSEMSMPPMIMIMQMWFDWSATGTTILFKGWTPSTHGQFVGALFGIMILAILKEGIYAYRKVALARMSSSAGVTPSDGGALLEHGAHGGHHHGHHSRGRGKAPLAARLIATLLYGVNMTLGYFLMLIVMTYNIGYTLAVIVGLMIGFFAFGGADGSSGAGPEECCEAD